MKIRITGITNGVASAKDLKEFVGTQAGVCYMPDTYDALLENPEASLKRFDTIVKSKHNSCLEHCYITLLFENCSKAFAMLLNSIRSYNTSEKSGRYTVMSADNALYDKWRNIFEQLYANENLTPRELKHRVLENARYVLSVFSNSTVFAYTVSWRTANRLYLMCENLCKEAKSDFMLKLVPELQEFMRFLKENLVIEGFRESYLGKLDFFDFEKSEDYFDSIPEQFGESYTMFYEASFVALAQAERHRLSTYKSILTSEPKYYIPTIIRGTVYAEEWVADLKTVEYPQAQLLRVMERGTLEGWLSKCTERLCGAAMEEIRVLTKDCLCKYADSYNSKAFEAFVGTDFVATKCKLCGECSSPCSIVNEISKR